MNEDSLVLIVGTKIFSCDASFCRLEQKPANYRRFRSCFEQNRLALSALSGRARALYSSLQGLFECRFLEHEVLRLLGCVESRSRLHHFWRIRQQVSLASPGGQEVGRKW